MTVPVLNSVGPLVCPVEYGVEGSLAVDIDVLSIGVVECGLVDTPIVVEEVAVGVESDELFLLVIDTLVVVVTLTVSFTDTVFSPKGSVDALDSGSFV